MKNTNEIYCYEKFKIRLLNDVGKIYAKVYIEEEVLIIRESYYEVSISLKENYESYCLTRDYGFFKEYIIGRIEEYMSKHKFKLNINSIYPLIKSKDFGQNESFPFVRDDLFLDLDILYAQDMGEMYRFINTKEISGIGNIKEIAFYNLNKVTNIIEELDKDIYMYRYSNDFNASMILKEDEFKKIINKVGNRFLLSIPNSVTLTIAMDNPINYNILSRLINDQEYQNKISEKIYRYNNGLWSYADLNMLKVVR